MRGVIETVWTDSNTPRMLCVLVWPGWCFSSDTLAVGLQIPAKKRQYYTLTGSPTHSSASPAHLLGSPTGVEVEDL